MKRFLLGCVVSVLMLYAGAVRAEKPVKPPVDWPTARAYLDSIWTASQIYYQDRGQWPEDVKDLMAEDHPWIRIDSSILTKWNFRITAGPPATLIASIADEETYGVPTPSVAFDTRTGTYRGEGAPVYGRRKLTPDDEAELARNAIGTIYGISQSVGVYVSNKGSWPETPEVLENEDYLEIQSGTALQWDFGFIGIPLETIVAVSTNSMPDGRGCVIEYDVMKNEWRGYGLAKLKALGDKYRFEGSIYVGFQAPADSSRMKKERPK